MGWERGLLAEARKGEAGEALGLDTKRAAALRAEEVDRKMDLAAVKDAIFRKWILKEQ